MLVAFKSVRVEIEDGGDDNNRRKILYKDEESIIEADRTRLSQVISNLLVNAIKFTKEEGTISIEVEKKKEVIIITIKKSSLLAS